MMDNLSYPQKQGLYDPFFEHDSCGVGFVVNVKGRKSHNIVRNGIQTLMNLSHRGATGSDPATGDGAGILVQLPDLFFRNEVSKQHIELPTAGRYGVGLVFLPTKDDERALCEEWIESIVYEEGQLFFGWRDVPHDLKKAGHVSRSAAPIFKQMFIGRGAGVPDQEAFERKLFLILKRAEHAVRP